MLNIADLAGGRLHWSQDSTWHRRFTLGSGDRVAGSLAFESVLGTRATAKTGDGCWTFKRIGFWQRRASVRRCGSDEELALFENDTWTGGGTLAFASGERVRATTNFWRSELRFEDEHGAPLVEFDYGGIFRLRADVIVAPAGHRLATLPVLVCFGWYLAVMLHQDTASAGAAAAAAG